MNAALSSPEVIVWSDGSIAPPPTGPREPASLELRPHRTLWQRVTGRGPGVLPMMLLARCNYFSNLWRRAEGRAQGALDDAHVYAEQLDYAMGALRTIANISRGEHAGDQDVGPFTPDELLEYIASTAERSRRHVLNIAVVRSRAPFSRRGVWP